MLLFLCKIKERYFMTKSKQYTTNDFKQYVVIGYYYNTKKRFKTFCVNYSQMSMINLWNGRKYGITHEGKRVLLETVTN
jgi:hypothetical protein